jgi:hypothetical protein
MVIPQQLIGLLARLLDRHFSRTEMTALLLEAGASAQVFSLYEPQRARKTYRLRALENVPGVGGQLNVYHRR